MPRVSIIVPSYNHAQFLRKCLEAVQGQSFSDWELILIDDGSKDDSVEIAKGFTDPRIRVLQNEVNLGTYGTEQKALNMAQGEFVAVLNSDDLWESTKLARQVELLEKYPEARLCYTLGWKVNQDDVIDREEDVHEDWPRTELQDPMPFLMYENRILASGVLFRRESLRFETTCRYSGDWLALLDQARRGPVACLTERLTYWRMHDNNTFVRSPKQLAEEVRVRRAIAEVGLGWARDAAQVPAIRNGLGRNALNLFALGTLFEDRSASLVAGLSAIKFTKDKKSAIKRTLSLLLPMSYLRSYFWKGGTIGEVEWPTAELRALISALAPLKLPSGPV